jgi:hypothetical protein
MTATIAFDVRNGRILSAHHGAVDHGRVRQSAQLHSKIDDKHIELITVNPYDLEKGKQYKVDLSRKSLVPTAVGETGVWFGFGTTGTTSN